jgi:predicted transcriptional regulator
MPNTAVSIKLSDEERERLARIAKVTKRSAHFVMREAVLQHLAAVEERLSFVQDAEDAWQEYKETGVAYSLDEVKAWFASDRSKPAPWQK